MTENRGQKGWPLRLTVFHLSSVIGLLTPDTRLRGRNRFGLAKARNLTALLLKEKIDKFNPYFTIYLSDTAPA